MPVTSRDIIADGEADQQCVQIRVEQRLMRHGKLQEGGSQSVQSMDFVSGTSGLDLRGLLTAIL